MELMHTAINWWDQIRDRHQHSKQLRHQAGTYVVTVYNLRRVRTLALAAFLPPWIIILSDLGLLN